MSYSHEVGDRLRRVRVDRGWSLQEVERASEGRWKAAVVGSYERGDRNISATRLLELAAFYGVPPAGILPGGSPRASSGGGGIVLDLRRLEELGDRFGPVLRYLDAIQVQRGDFNRRVLSIRGEDLRALAVLHDSGPDELLDALRSVGALGEANRPG